MGDRHSDAESMCRGGRAVHGHHIGPKLMDTLMILIYIYIGLFGLIIGVIAWGIHREGQSHDPER